jgi:hypothetical protein
METMLEVDGQESKDEPTAEDIAAAIDGPRGEDFYITLHRGDDDYMDVTEIRGDLCVEAEEGGTFLEARSHVDAAAAKAMMAAFAANRAEWRDLAAWAEPDRTPQSVPMAVRALVIASIVVAVGCVGTMIFTRNGGWFLLMLGLAFPIALAFVVLVKQEEVKRAAAWSKASGRVVRSEIGQEIRHGKTVVTPLVEYEFTVGFHKYRGRRVSLGEMMSAGDAEQAIARYKPGTGVTVFHDPKDPRKSVLERDPPPYFNAVWGVVAVSAVAAIGLGYLFLVR